MYHVLYILATVSICRIVEPTYLNSYTSGTSFLCSFNVVVIVVRLGHSHSFNDSIDNHSTASGWRRCSPPGNAVSGHSSTMRFVVWWLSPQGASRCCDHAPSVERFGASGLSTSQTIQCDELASR